MKIALPIEVKIRELKERVWLSMNFLERGHRVVIGETYSIVEGIDRIEPDVYFRGGTRYNERRIEFAESLREQGGRVAILDTEGGVFRDQEWFTGNLSQRTLDHSDVYFAWGERQAALLEKAAEYPEERIVVSGHPVFDLLGEDLRQVYEAEANELVDKYGNYVLVNTNFVAGNNSTQPDSKFEDDKLRYEAKLLDEYLLMMRRFAQDIVGYHVIVRPHPLEDLGTYTEALSDFENISVTREGNVRHWLLGADASIHKSSTTGIESALMNVPTFSYGPFKDERYDSDLPIRVSDERTDYRNLLDGLTTALEDDRKYEISDGQKQELRQYIHNIDGTSATGTIVDHVDEFPAPTEVDLDGVSPSPKQRLKRFGTKYFGIDATERAGELLLGSDYSAVRRKFEGLTREELYDEMRLFDEHVAIDVEQVEIVRIPELPNTFELHAE